MVWSRLLLPVLGGVLVAANGSVHSVHGVEPLRQELYVGDAHNKWKCLNDSSVVLDVSQINDGICDCPDGSDEPGTGACGLKAPLFYCSNEGFIPRYISQSKVNDGVCDCCDCSDELLSPVKPFYRGSQCSELKEAFARVREMELQKFEEGSKELRDLYRRFQLEDQSGSVDKELLAKEIENISEEFVNREIALASLKAKRMEQLRSGNPLLYQFEQLDAEYLASQINSSFERVVEVSKAYESLVKILDTLRNSYSRSLNDKVVNDNVKRYDFMKSQSLKKLSCDSKVEEEQRLQLIEYLQGELPRMFAEGMIDKPPKYISGKITFVENMVFGKVSYVETVISKIKQLSGLMSDVSNNYNVNYQDSGVKEAVESYKNWLTKFQSLLRKDSLLLPKEFETKLKQLQKFIEANADRILTPNGGEQAQSSFQNALQHWSFLRRKVSEFFKPNLVNQITNLGCTVEQLKERLDTKRQEYHTLESREKGEENQQLERLKLLINALSEGHPLNNLIDNYIYEINLGGSIYQKENSPTGNQIKIGDFQGLSLQETDAKSIFFEYLKSAYPDEDDLFPALISETDGDQERYLFGDLHETSNGLLLNYANGDKCWNGPRRSARIKVRCARSFEITKVYEMTKCNYGIEMAGPIGCNLG